MKNDPLYSARRTLHTGAGLLTDKQNDRLTALFADDAHVEVEATWGIYQQMIAAYREEDRRRGRELTVKLIESISAGVPKALTEAITLGRTLKKRAADVLAYFDRPGTSNGPTEAINGRLEHMRGSTLGFRTLTNYIARTVALRGPLIPRLPWRSASTTAVSSSSDQPLWIVRIGRPRPQHQWPTACSGDLGGKERLLDVLPECRVGVAGDWLSTLRGRAASRPSILLTVKEGLEFDDTARSLLPSLPRFDQAAVDLRPRGCIDIYGPVSDNALPDVEEGSNNHFLQAVANGDPSGLR